LPFITWMVAVHQTDQKIRWDHPQSSQPLDPELTGIIRGIFHRDCYVLNGGGPSFDSGSETCLSPDCGLNLCLIRPYGRSSPPSSDPRGINCPGFGLEDSGLPRALYRASAGSEDRHPFSDRFQIRQKLEASTPGLVGVLCGGDAVRCKGRQPSALLWDRLLERSIHPFIKTIWGK
jgi:hypothetical protein